MEDGAVQYSILLVDVLGNQIFNIPNAIGVNLPVDLNQLPPVTIIDEATILGNTDASLIINSGVATGSKGAVEYQEGGVSQWLWLRQAIVDGGAMILRRLAGSGQPDDPIEFPYVGGMIARWLGTDRIRVEADGVAILGLLKNNPQALVAGGTFLHAGGAVGLNFGIDAGAFTGNTGEYTITLDFVPSAASNLVVGVVAELSNVPIAAWGEGGGLTSTIDIKTGPSGALANVTSYTVLAFDMGLS